MRQAFVVGTMLFYFVSLGACIDHPDEQATTQNEAAITSANPPSPGAQPAGGGGGCTQLVQTGTLYYADAGRTQLIGTCTITCAQWVQGVAAPFFGQGGTCQGSDSNFTSGIITTCVGCRF